MKSFINVYSYKCLLGPQSKNSEIIGNLAAWQVGKKSHFANLALFDENDIKFLQQYGPCNFHYLTHANYELLWAYGFKVKKTKLNSTCINLNELSYVGRKYHGIRGAINKNAKLHFTIQDNFNDIKDIKDMIEIWSNDYTKNYFRDFSGKNTFFYKNNFHRDCNNIFVYDDKKLIAFASLSPGKNSSYIIGKSLFKDYAGLSEYTDDLIYKKVYKLGTRIVNLGQSKGGIATYKDKWPNTYSIIHYDGNII